MTLEEFATKLKALLMEALNAGHSVDEVGQTAEDVLEGEWEE